MVQGPQEVTKNCTFIGVVSFLMCSAYYSKESLERNQHPIKLSCCNSFVC